MIARRAVAQRLAAADVLAPTEPYHPTAPGQSLGFLPVLDRFS
ncbi:hypothetical protein AB0D11_44865 [Streptomyces monashensis]